MPRRQSYLGKRRPHATWIHRERPGETVKERTERLEFQRGFKEMAAKARFRSLVNNNERGPDQ